MVDKRLRAGSIALGLLVLAALVAVVAADDTTPPVVVSTNPAKDATGVGTDPAISVTFNEPTGFSEFDPTMRIKIEGGGEVLAIDQYTNNGPTVTFGRGEGVPWLKENTAYTVTIAGFKDQTGNAMAEPYAWSFTTGAADTTPPTVVSSSPADQALHVPVDLGAITITFGEPIVWDTTPVPGFGSMSAHLYEFDWTEVPLGAISASGTTLTISAPSSPSPWLKKWDWDADPTAPGQQMTGIYRLIVYGVRDLAGNRMTDSVDIGFYTVAVDTTPPTVVSTSPADGDDGVATDAAITATMSEDVNRCVGTATIVDDLGNTVALKPGQGWDATDYKTVEVYPAAPLVVGRTYTVTLEGLVDNYMNKLAAPYSWSFTVGDAPTAVAKASPWPVALVNEKVSFDGTGSTDADGTIVSYAWNFGDGSTASTATATHAYAVGGDYTVNLKVTDNVGLSGSTSFVYKVRTPAEVTHGLFVTVDNLGLPATIEKGLMDKLATAEQQITQKKYGPARQTLLAFINQVNAQKGKGIIPASKADDLIAEANRILASIPAK
jgi:methionine-rich copper-binding protein CopC